MVLRLQGVYQLALLLRGHTAKYRHLFGRFCQLTVILQLRGIHPVFRPGNARLRRHTADCARVVARNHLDLHTLLGKVGKGLGGVGADGVLQRQQRQKLQPRGIGLVARRQCAVIPRQQQHAAAGIQQGGQLRGKLGAARPCQHVGCTHHTHAPALQSFGTVFVGRVKGDRLPHRPAGLALPIRFLQRPAGVVVGDIPRVAAAQHVA